MASVEVEAPPTAVPVLLVTWLPPPKALDDESVEEVSVDDESVEEVSPVLGSPPTLFTWPPTLDVPPEPVTVVLALLLEGVVAVAPSLVEPLVETVPIPVVSVLAVEVVDAEVSSEDGFASEQRLKTATSIRTSRPVMGERSRGKRRIALQLIEPGSRGHFFSTHRQALASENLTDGRGAERPWGIMTSSRIFASLAGSPRTGYVRAICCLALACRTVIACAGSNEGDPQATAVTGTGSNAGGTSTTGVPPGSAAETSTTVSSSGQAVTSSSGSESTASGSTGGAFAASTTTAGLGAGGSGTVGAVDTTTGSLNTGGTVGTSDAGSTRGADATVGMGGPVTASATDGAGGAVGTEGTVSGGQGGTGDTGNTFSVCSAPPPQGARVVTVHVIGDSTASIYGSDLYPRTGWGQVLGDYYAPACAVVNDKALSGRSSKSFYDEGAWMPVRGALVEGDFVLIQFGHNDEKSDDPTRYTDPQTTFKQYLTTYITDTRTRNATPVLLTPINRNNWNGATLKDTHGDYPTAIRELAGDLDVALIDLTALTKTYFESLGPATTSDLFMNLDPGEFPNYPDGNSDNTHLREAGARVVAELLNHDAYSQQLPLAALLASVPTGP